jgi:membrane protein DedA with SNARE-associated domain/membrane-associated phospholipid phosphatase
MNEIIHAIVHFAEAHAGLVYVIAFAAASFESIALVGLVVPGSGIIVALGALVPSGAVGFWWLCLWSVLGALSGDGISYWIGHRYRDRIRHVWPFTRHPAVLEHGETFFAKHGGKSVFFSRFVAPVRGGVPLVAGMAGMGPGRFFAVSALSALGWAPAHILPGALIGAGLQLTGGVAARLLVLVVLLGAVLWLAARIAVLAVRHGKPLLVVAQQRASAWARRHDNWFARQVLALLDPAQGEAPVLTLLALVLAGAAATFFGVLEDVVTGDPLVRADTAIFNLLQGLRSEVADRAMIAMTELGGAVVAGAVAAAIMLWLIWRRAWHAAAYWVAAVGGAYLIGIVIKATLHRPRPAPLYAGWDAFSFPSSHAATSAAIYGFLAVLIARDARPAWQALTAAAAVLAVALIGISRLYLGAHWFSDVVGGFAFGAAWMALLGIAYVRHNPPSLAGAPLAAIAAAAIGIVGSVQIAREMPTDLERYAVRPSERTMAAANWWHDGWRSVPLRRIDLAGEREEPLVLQWAGSLDVLQSDLGAGGWRQPASWSAATALSWIGPAADPLTLPALPRLHDGRAPALTLIHAKGGGAHPVARWVLRVWKTEIQLTAPDGSAQPLWVAAVSLERFHGPFAPFALGFERSRVAAPWRLLEQALKDAGRTFRVDDQAGVRVMLAQEPARSGLAWSQRDGMRPATGRAALRQPFSAELRRTRGDRPARRRCPVAA